MKSYRSTSSSTLVTVDLRLHELLSFVQNSVCHTSFSVLFFTLLSHIWMKVGRKLLYEELEIKFDFPFSWPTFWWVIARWPLLKLAAWCCLQIWIHRDQLGTCIAKAILSVCLFYFEYILYNTTLFMVKMYSGIALVKQYITTCNNITLEL